MKTLIVIFLLWASFTAGCMFSFWWCMSRVTGRDWMIKTLRKYHCAEMSNDKHRNHLRFQREDGEPNTEISHDRNGEPKR